MNRHDPERGAARYLSGTFSDRARRRFEAHLVDCPDCWHEVRVGGMGRAMAESGRELAPQRLREQVRGRIRIAAGDPHPRHRVSGVASLGLAVATIGVSLVLLLVPRQPEAIERLVDEFGGQGRLAEPVRADLPGVLGDLELTGAASGQLDGLDVVVHRYRDAAGHRVAVYSSEQRFPVAAGAVHDSARATWHASIDGFEVFCAEEPFNALVIGDDRREVRLAAASLELGR